MKLSPKLEEEIAYLLDLDRDEPEPGETPYGRSDALQQLMQDMDMPDTVASEFRRELEDYGAWLGVFKPHTKAQIDSIISIGRGKKYDFKRCDVFFIFESWAPIASRAALTVED